MPIKDEMSTKLITVSPDDNLGRMKSFVDKLNIHHVLVVLDKRLLGIVSDRDILRNLSPFIDSAQEAPRDRALLKIKASQIMTKNPYTIHQASSMREAGKIILEKKISLLPVVNDNGDLVGVISWKDVLRFAIN